MGFFNSLFNTPLDNFSIAIKHVCNELTIPFEDTYKLTYEDQVSIYQALGFGTIKINPMIYKGIKFYSLHSRSGLEGYNVRDVAYQIHIDVAKLQFGKDVQETIEECKKDEATLLKHFGY